MIGHNYLDQNDMVIYYKIDHPSTSVQNRFTFRHAELPTFGVGPFGFPIINCDPYIDLELLNGIEDEFNSNVNKVNDKLHKMIPFGLVPFDINNQKCLDSFLTNLNKYDPNQSYKTIGNEKIHYHEFKDLMCNKFTINKPWHDILHIRKLKTFFQKNEPSEYNESAQYFPKLVRLINSLPFKSIGYAMIMRNNRKCPLDIHRDIFMQNHSCHHINIAIDKKPRPVFVYDCISKEKIYKPIGCFSYFFNECDFHGADAIDDVRLTLRVDGVFTDQFSQAIGLERGKTFDWYYDKPVDFIKANGKIKIEFETDI